MARANGNGVNRGAGVVAPAPTHVTACPNSKNPAGHNPNCHCTGVVVVPGIDREKFEAWKRSRPPQTIPYEEPE